MSNGEIPVQYRYGTGNGMDGFSSSDLSPYQVAQQLYT